ncbi:MAG: aconitase X catalytic domain-containing protein [Candidatus Rokubacteria bacterium]|nr:aconitase X catalytic domain-containing protein [Candidatus Rokubacteria bacterium]
MDLTREEVAILAGDEGPGPRLALELLCEFGEIFGARRLIPIASVHTAGHLGSLHQAGLDLLERFVSLGARYRVPTTINPSSLGCERCEPFTPPPGYVEKQERLHRLHEILGVTPNWSCTPYFEHPPAFGEAVAWIESHAISLVNSYFGARTERLAIGIDVPAAILGRFPEFGLYLPENRVPRILIDLVGFERMDLLDYDSVGYLVGLLARDQIPYIRGLPARSTFDQIRSLGAAAAASGAVPLYHAEGLTAEVKRGAIRVDPARLAERHTVTRADLEAVEERLTTTAAEVDLVIVGCPHLSIDQMQDLARRMSGRTCAETLPLWIYTSSRIKEECRKDGTLALLEAAGAWVLTGTCAVTSPVRHSPFKTVMTNSAKAANVLPAEHGLGVVYASLERCLRTAIAGRRA